jgi:hypothetical protein
MPDRILPLQLDNYHLDFVTCRYHRPGKRSVGSARAAACDNNTEGFMLHNIDECAVPIRGRYEEGDCGEAPCLRSTISFFQEDKTH